MKLTYSLESKDYINFNLYHISHTEAIKAKLNKQRLMGSGLLLLVGLIMMYFAKNSQMAVGVIAALVAAYWYMNFPKTSRARIIKSTQKAIDDGKLLDLFSEVTLEFTDEGIIESANEASNRSTWGNIVKYSEVNDYLFLFLENNSAILIPKRVLEENELVDLKAIIEKNFKGEHEIIDF